MPRTYAPKKIEVVFEQVEAKSEEMEQRLTDAYAILFEETLKFLKEQKQKSIHKDNNLKSQNQIPKGGEQYERRYAH